MDAAISQLAALGFSTSHAAKGLEQTKVNGQISLDRAAGWCVSHPDQGHRAPAPAPKPVKKAPDVKESDVRQIISMGFSRKHAEKGLRMKRNNVQEAAFWCATNKDVYAEAKSSRSPTRRPTQKTTVKKPTASKPPKSSSRPKYKIAADIVDTPAKQRKRMEERKKLEEMYLREQASMEIKKKTKVQKMELEEGRDEKVVESTAIVATAVKRKHLNEKQIATRKAMEESKRRDKRKMDELQARKHKRRQEEEKLGGLKGALQYLHKNYPIERVKGIFTLISKIGKKILKDPKEPKFRRIKLSNERIQKALVRPLGAMVIMKSLGFKETGEIVVMEKVDTKQITRILEVLSRYMGRSATKIPQLLKIAESKGVPHEDILYAAQYLRKILSAVVGLPESAQLRTLSMKPGSIYDERFRPHGILVQVLEILGFKKYKADHIRLENPNVLLLNDTISDLDNEISKRLTNTRVAAALRDTLREHGKEKAVYVQDKAKTCLRRIQKSPEEKKFWKIDLKRLFGSAGTLKPAALLYSGLGFTVKGNIAEYKGGDRSGIKSGLAHLDAVGKLLLA